MELKVSKEFGLNPSRVVCILCGQFYAIALLGHNKGKEAPPHIHSGVCPECEGFMKEGIILVEVSNDLSRKAGGFVVIQEECVLDAMKEGEKKEQVKKKRYAFIPEEQWNAMGLNELVRSFYGNKEN